MSPNHTYSDADLTQAVQASRSWRGVLRELGLRATSAGSMRSARRRADALGLDYSHFTGARTWSEGALVAAVSEARDWSAVLDRLGLSGSGGNLMAVRGHAVRMSLDIDHLSRTPPRPAPLLTTRPRPQLLRTAAGNLAAAWFELRGYSILWPREPCRYDFVVSAGDSFERIQVKTTTYRYAGSSVAMISSTRQDSRAAYDVDDIDHFFVIDEALDAFLIPIAAVAGLKTISLRAYQEYLVAERGQWLGDSEHVGETPDEQLSAASSP